MTERDLAPEETEVDGDSDRLTEIHKRAMERFAATVEPQLAVRAQALAARRFASLTGAQWEGIPDDGNASPRMQINKVRYSIRKVEMDYRTNRIVPDFRPAGGDSDNETADLLDGLHRADSYNSKAGQARDNAFLEGLKGGMGAYRLTNIYADPYDKDSDYQRINPALIIPDADQSVFFDGDSKLYDKANAQFAFVLTSMTPPSAADEYGKHLATWDDGLLRYNLSWFDWYRQDMIRICEYYEVEDKDERLVIFTNRLTDQEERFFASEIGADEIRDRKAQGWSKRERKVKRRRIHKYTMSGSEVLRDAGYIAGDRIPIVVFYATRDYVDNQEWFQGITQPLMDSQIIYNMAVSKNFETDLLSPREIPILTPDQVAGHEQRWADQNIERHPYALINPMFAEDGSVLAMGPIGKIEPPQIPPVRAILMQQANADLMEDLQNADEVKANTSAEAMDIAAARVDAKSGPLLDNWRMSVEWEGEIYKGMAREVYFEPGRKVETMTEDGDDGEAELHQMVTDKKTGASRVIHDLQRGKYKVIADVQEATATKRDKTAKRLIEIGTALAATDPQQSAIAFQMAVTNMDGEGIGDYQKFVRKGLVAAGVMEPTEDEAAEIERQSQEQQQPDLAEQLQAGLMQAEIALKTAQKGQTDQKAREAMASAMLKFAQAMTLGGPSNAPEVPSGLDQAETVAKIEKHQADAEWTRTDAALMPEKLALEREKIQQRPRIRTGRELAH